MCGERSSPLSLFTEHQTPITRHHAYLRSDDPLDSHLACCLRETDGPAKLVVIGERECWQSEIRRSRRQYFG